MISSRALRSLFAGRLEESRQQGGSGAYGRGRLAALAEFHDTLGLDTNPRTGAPMIPIDERGLPLLKEGRAHGTEISLRGLAEAIMEHDFVEEYYHPSSGFSFRELQEAAIDPTAFVDINTFNLATAGLLQAEIMERFNQPQFIGRNLVKVVPTKKNGDKLIAVARLSSVSNDAKGRQPGEAHAEIGFGQAYQTTPVTVERALKCVVTREAVFYDITDQVTEEAQAVGDELGYGMEKDIADMILGVTNSHNRNGTSYNTYQTTSPWVNDQSNPFSDETDLDESRQLFVGMTDPESGKEIVIEGRDILVMPARELKFREQLFGSNIQVGTQLNSSFPSRWKMSTTQINAVSGGPYNIVPLSAIWYNRATAADGLALSAANAKEYWWHGDFQKCFEFRENWPMTPWLASADEYHLKDRGLVLAVGANYRGVPYVRQPRYIIRNKS